MLDRRITTFIHRYTPRKFVFDPRVIVKENDLRFVSSLAP
jgi:hypothetical protein